MGEEMEPTRGGLVGTTNAVTSESEAVKPSNARVGPAA
jgi:hypothetical protein